MMKQTLRTVAGSLNPHVFRIKAVLLLLHLPFSGHHDRQPNYLQVDGAQRGPPDPCQSWLRPCIGGAEQGEERWQCACMGDAVSKAMNRGGFLCNGFSSCGPRPIQVVNQFSHF